MINRVLSISDVYVTDKPVTYTCYGLGSCIGLFISDRRKGLSAGAHIPLPGPVRESDFAEVSTMIRKMLNYLHCLGSDLSSLRAKVTGGAQVYDASPAIGKQNTEAVLKQLIDHRIFIAAVDVGGRVSRTARFNGTTGELLITTSEQKTYCI
jgi:chemotaxis protein CheD